MNKPKAILIGILSIAPLAFMVCFLTVAGNIIFGSPQGNHDVLPFYIFKTGPFAILIVSLLIVYFIYHIFIKSIVPSEKKYQWAVFLLFCHFLAFPFYWYFYIWKPLTASPSA